MKNIQHLNLRYNSLEGPLPAIDAGQHSLDFLSLDFNALTGCAPTPLLSASLHAQEAAATVHCAVAVYLSTKNVCCRSLPPSWAQMTNLSMLWLDRNQLNGSLPDAWGATLAGTGRPLAGQSRTKRRDSSLGKLLLVDTYR